MLGITLSPNRHSRTPTILWMKNNVCTLWVSTLFCSAPTHTSISRALPPPPHPPRPVISQGHVKTITITDNGLTTTTCSPPARKQAAKSEFDVHLHDYDYTRTTSLLYSYDEDEGDEEEQCALSEYLNNRFCVFVYIASKQAWTAYTYIISSSSASALSSTSRTEQPAISSTSHLKTPCHVYHLQVWFETRCLFVFIVSCSCFCYLFSFFFCLSLFLCFTRLWYITLTLI